MPAGLESITAYRLDPSSWLVLGTGLAALLLVALDGVWRWTRNVVTIVHEAGHAIVAVATGRRLTGIRLHSDTSGLTLSVGRPTGPGMVLTTAAGYLSPTFVGLIGVAVLTLEQVTIMLWVATAVLLGMLVMVRNAYGILTVLVTGAIVVAVSLYANADTQAAFGHVATWFLLFGGVRPVSELWRERRRLRTRSTDADQLARLTGLPGGAWVALFATLTLAGLAAGAWLLLS
jgi:Peptidase M50B-like